MSKNTLLKERLYKLQQKSDQVRNTEDAEILLAEIQALDDAIKEEYNEVLNNGPTPIDKVVQEIKLIELEDIEDQTECLFDIVEDKIY